MLKVALFIKGGANKMALVIKHIANLDINQ